MRELSAIVGSLKRVFAEAGYGEVATPALEYEEVLARADVGDAAGVPGRRRPRRRPRAALGHDGADRAGRRDALRDGRAAAALLLRRADLPRRCARTAACRASSCRPASSSSASRRRTGPPRRSPCCAGRWRRSGCATSASASATPRCSRGCSTRPASTAPRASASSASWRRATSSGWSASSACCASTTRRTSLLLRVARLRGGPEVLDERGRRRSATPPTACAALRAGCRPRWRERLIFDLGLARDLGYYTGAVFEVYDPGLGVPLGGGGRYDDLLGRFGRSLPGRRVRAAHRRPPPGADGVHGHA